VDNTLNMIVVLVALATGVFAIGCVCWVWVQHQVCKVGGSVLAVLGVILIGISVWGKVQIEVGPLKAILEKLHQEIEESREDAIESKAELGRLLMQLTAALDESDIDEARRIASVIEDEELEDQEPIYVGITSGPSGQPEAVEFILLQPTILALVITTLFIISILLKTLQKTKETTKKI